MALLEKIPVQKTNVLSDQAEVAMATQLSDELTIHVHSSHDHESAMPEDLKKKKRANAPSLMNLFQETLKEKGEFNSSQTKQIAYGEIEANGLSNTALHSFILKAEELGKKVTYSKTLTVKISD